LERLRTRAEEEKNTRGWDGKGEGRVHVVGNGGSPVWDEGISVGME
jgi:hypothetical protein